MRRFIIGFIVLLAIAFLAYSIITGEGENTGEVVPTAIQEVELSKVGELSVEEASVVAFGQVVSSNSVSVVPERSGVVASVGARLGDTVRPGQVVVQLQNSSERQAVLQAQAQLNSAQASLTNTTRDADTDLVRQAEAGVAQAEAALASTEANVLAGLDQVYVQFEGLIRQTFTDFFNNPTSTFPSLRISEINNQNTRISLEQALTNLNLSVDQDRDYDNPAGAFLQVRELVDEYNDVVDVVRAAVLALEPSASISQATLSRWDNDLANGINSARSIDVTINQLSAQLQSAESSVVSAQASLQDLQAGANNQDITIAQSGVSSARAGLTASQIELNKTRITAPIFGRISSIETRVGQLVGPSSPVFVITSSGSKRIDVFVSEQEARRLSVGDPVRINNSIDGSISRIAPSIDTNTGKIKVEIFPDAQIDLVEGSGVTVSIATQTETRGTAIPIEAVFVRSGQSYVYVVREGVATLQPIETEGLFGPVVRVTSGLASEDVIVLSARGVSDNQQVSEVVEREDEELETTSTSTTE